MRTPNLAAIAFASLLVGGPAHATARTVMDGVVDAARAKGFSGVVLAGDADGLDYQRLVTGAAGPARLDDLWRWASVTKQLTAVLVMQEVEKGNLALDRPITAYLPEFTGPTGDAVTIRQLLQHNSGLPNPDEAPDFYLTDVAASADRTAALGWCAGPPKAQPGAGFAYNNCDYLLLGAILEGVTVRDYAQLVAERIAGPAGAASPKPFPSKRSDAPRTIGGDAAPGQPEPIFNFATFGAAGGLYGTPLDMLRVDIALMSGAYLSQSSLQAMWTGDPQLGFAALGAWSFPAALEGCNAEVALVERRGQIGGVQVRNILAPALGKALVVFANSPTVEFGEIWQGAGLSYDLANAAFCTAAG